MSLQAIIALASALIGLSACTDHEIDVALASLKGDQARLDQLNQNQDGRIAALYAQVSSQAQESTSSSSSIAASQIATVQEPSSSSEYIAPLTEPCDAGSSQFRVWTCDSTGHRSYI